MSSQCKWELRHWQVAARAEDNFALFLPHLEALMDVNRRYARAAQTERHAHPCDAGL